MLNNETTPIEENTCARKAKQATDKIPNAKYDP